MTDLEQRTGRAVGLITLAKALGVRAPFAVTDKPLTEEEHHKLFSALNACAAQIRQHLDSKLLVSKSPSDE